MKSDLLVLPLPFLTSPLQNVLVAGPSELIGRACFATRHSEGFEMNLYIAQEYLGVLLVLAVSIAILLVFAVAFVVVQEGIRRAMLWGKPIVGPTSALRRSQAL